MKALKVIKQELKEDYILQIMEDGSTKKVMYKIDENGDEYAELFPNGIIK